MSMLVAAAIVFLGIHFFVSGTRLRDAIVRAIEHVQRAARRT